MPEPQPGAVLLRMTQAGICGSDLHTWRGDQTQEHLPLPETGRVMGHEGTGVIRVFGRRRNLRLLRHRGRGGRPGHLRRRVSLLPLPHVPARQHQLVRQPTVSPPPESGLTSPAPTAISCTCRRGIPFFRVPDELPDSILGPVNCAMGTVTTGLERAGMSHGQSVVIMGAGGLGIHATAMAKERGADRIIVLDRLENRLALAEEFGADHTINIEEFNTPETRVRRVRELTRGRGADVVMELVGRADLLKEGIDMLSNGGTFVEIGDIVRGQEVSIDPSKLLQGKNIVGSLMYRPSLLPELLDFLVRNQDRLPLQQAGLPHLPPGRCERGIRGGRVEPAADGDNAGNAGAVAQDKAIHFRRLGAKVELYRWEGRKSRSSLPCQRKRNNEALNVDAAATSLIFLTKLPNTTSVVIR